MNSNLYVITAFGVACVLWQASKRTARVASLAWRVAAMLLGQRVERQTGGEVQDLAGHLGGQQRGGRHPPVEKGDGWEQENEAVDGWEQENEAVCSKHARHQ
jgi:hypothetical protein